MRRSFVHHCLVELDARFDDHGVAMGFGRLDEAAAAARLGLADLSVLPRTGFKGAGALDWLAGQGLALGEPANRAYRQAGDLLAAKLAPTEALILGPLDGADAAIDRLTAAWSIDSAGACYMVPRRESHAWFRITGSAASAMFAKLCAVDHRPAKFPGDAIAQTSVARLNGIVIRDDLAQIPAYHLLADSASAEYLWRVLLDAMAEFDGVPVGRDALLAIADT